MKTLALGERNSQFYKSIESIINNFNPIEFVSEHKFAKVSQLIDYVSENGITQVLMPNPYGNNKRKTCYFKLKEHGVKVICSDRGALPNTWFFDVGFNADSESFRREKWDFELTDEQKNSVDEYISREVNGKYLEQQSSRIGGDVLKQKLGISESKKIVFVPFQRPNDTVIKFFSENCGGMDGFIEWIQYASEQLSDYTFVLKKHPLEKDYVKFDGANIKYVPESTNIDDLISISDVIVLINSGVGVLSLVANKPVICCGDSFYISKGLSVQASDKDDLVQKIKNEINPCEDTVKKFIYHLIENVYSKVDFETERRDEGAAFRTVTKKIKFKNININGQRCSVNKKKVLVVSPLVPYPIYRGNQQRIDSFLKVLLNNKDLEVSLAVLNTSFGNKKSCDIKNELVKHYVGVANVEVIKDPKFIKGKKALKYKFINSIEKITGKNSNISNNTTCPYNFVSRVNKMISDINPDVILTNYAKTTNVIPEHCSAKLVLDSHDYQTEFLLEDITVNNVKAKVNVDKFRESEHVALNRFNEVIAINPLECEKFKETILNNNVVSSYIPAFEEKHEKINMFWGCSYDALFVGSVSNFNVSGLKWFLDNVLPIVVDKKPDFNLAVAGNIINSKLIQKDKYPNVEFLGIVPSLGDVYENAKIVIAPILGGAGMKIKVVEALSYGKAIVGTHKAFEGINFKEYSAALVTDSENEFAKNVLSLIEDDSALSLIEENAVDLHEKEHSIKAISDKLMRIIND